MSEVSIYNQEEIRFLLLALNAFHQNSTPVHKKLVFSVEASASLVSFTGTNALWLILSRWVSNSLVFPAGGTTHVNLFWVISF